MLGRDDDPANVGPTLQVPAPTAQAIVDRVVKGRTVAALRSIHGGKIAAVYEVAFVAPHPPLVLKVFPDWLHWKMQKEANVAGLVAGRLSVPAPRILLADDSKTLLDLNFILMSKLEGTLLGSLEASFSPQQRAAGYAQIGGLLREFHQISMDAFGYIGAAGVVTPHPDNHRYLTAQFDRKLNEFTARGGPAGLVPGVAGFVADHAELLRDCATPVLCHNDLHPGNLLAILVEGIPRLSGVVDFEGALAGDPLMDLAKTLYFLDGADRRAVLDGYGEIDRHRWSETLDLYHLYFVLELWCWFAQIGNRAPLDKLAADLERLSGG